MVWSPDDCMCCSLFLSYGGRDSISEWHLVIRLAQLGVFCLSLLSQWEQLSCPRYLCFPAGIAASLKLLLFCPRAQSLEKGLGVESQRALLGSSGQSFPALWVSVEWAATVKLRFYCFSGFWVLFFFFSPPPPNTTSLPAPQKAWQSCWLPCNGLFSCWVEQYCCHMLKATISPRRCMSKAAAIPFPCWQM